MAGSATTDRDLIEALNRDPLLVLAGPEALYLSAHTPTHEKRPMLEPLASAMEQPPNLRDEWGSFAGSMIWLRVNALRQMVTVMIKSFDFSDPMGWTDASKKIALLSVPLKSTRLMQIENTRFKTSHEQRDKPEYSQMP